MHVLLLRALLVVLAAGCAADDPDDGLPDATSGSFRAACWHGVCSPDTRYFVFDGEPYDLELMFSSAIFADARLEALCDHLLFGEVEFAAGVIPEAADAFVCGQKAATETLEAFGDGRLRGRIEGSVRRCRTVEGDISDSTGVEPYPFAIHFDLAFDPNEATPTSSP